MAVNTRLLALCLLLLRPSVGMAADSCASALPSSLRSAFLRGHPGYRLVLSADYPADTPALQAGSDPSTCLAVSSGDFDGDGRKDFVFLALRAKGTIHAFVGLSRRQGWSISELMDMKEAFPGCCYADIVPPGHYEDVYGTEPDPETPLRPGQALEFTSPHEAPIVGSLESTGIAYFLFRGRWVHVWISD
jgi:hypothetical protein